jgi:DNA polymerase I
MFNVGIIDTNAIIYRYSYGMKNFVLENSKYNVGGLFGFLNLLQTYCKSLHINKIYLSIEGKKNFKKELFSEYKSNREPMPEFIKKQFVYLKYIIEALPICVIKKQTFEGDDIIGLICNVLCNNFSHQISNIYIFTTDKDLLQLIDVEKKIKVILINKEKKIITNKFQVKQIVGVFPKQIPDYFALVGDRTDNFNGVPGIGKKIGRKLINQFNNIDNMFLNMHLIDNKYKIIIQQHKKNIYMYKIIASINNLQKFNKSYRIKKKIMNYIKNINNNNFNKELFLKRINKFNLIKFRNFYKILLI